MSNTGCRFDLHTEVEKESIVAIRLAERGRRQDADSRPLLYQINWVEIQPNGWRVGVSRMQSGTIWHTEIPALKTES
ncbi:MAG: hypothetical protein ACRD5M_02165 [Candidatus Acidiferrales bacterium]